MFVHCLASTLPHSFRVSVSLLSEILSTNLSNSAKNSVLCVSCVPSTDVSGYAPGLPGQIMPRALGVVLRRSTSESRRGRCSNSGDVLDQKTATTQYTRLCLFFHDVWITFLGFIVGLISHCCSRRTLVERSLCSKWLTMSFPTSSIPAILF